MSSPHAPDLSEWIGRSRSVPDRIGAVPARAMNALLDRDPHGIAEGDVLPHGWHWLYFLHLPRRSRLGPDGHEVRGDFLPPVPLPRRMWAGGSLRFHAPIHLGESLVRTSSIESVTPKVGRSGRLEFVEVCHRIEGAAGDLRVDEVQTLVYRDARLAHPSRARDGAEAGMSAPGRSDGREGSGPPRRAPAPASAADATRRAGTGREGGDAAAGTEAPAGTAGWSETFVPDRVTLFRFSALTFNGHRIHYDHPYATDHEGYPDLVVHAPLLALLLLDAGIRSGVGRPSTFEYRAMRPVYAGQEVRLESRATPGGPSRALQAVAPGGVCMEASLD